MLFTKLRSINARILPQHLFYGPNWLVLGVNNICNLHCKMCDVGVQYRESNFYHHLMGAKPVNMPLDLMSNIINQAATYYPNVKLGFAFTEPLIYPHLIESLRMAKSKNLRTAITTNALNLRRYAEGILDSGLDNLFISLDGPPDIHNFIRGNPSSFEKAMEGIEYLLTKNNHPEIHVFCTITEWNIGHLVEFVKIFSHLKLKQIGFLHMNFTSLSIANTQNEKFPKYKSTSSNMSAIDINNMDLRLLWKEMQELQSMVLDFPVNFSPNIKSREILDVYYHHPEIFIGKRCNDAYSNIMIKSNGDVIPAHGRCYDITLGNMYQQDIKTIWNASSSARFRQDLNAAGGLMPACSRCCSAF